MSTRCQIRWEEEYEFENEEGKREIVKNIAQIYRHWDGYPDSVLGVISDLKKFLDWYEGEPMPRRGDISYACADFIYFMKKRYAERNADNPYAKGWEKLGYGVENPNDGIHGDEQYLYIITYKDGKWHIKVSGQWSDDDTEKAFDKAEWEFEGTLDEAYEKYVVENAEEDD